MLQDVIATAAKVFINLFQGFLISTGTILGGNSEGRLANFHLENFILAILIISVLQWGLGFLRYILRILRWMLIVCAITKIVLDLFNGNAVSNYSPENFRNGALSVLVAFKNHISGNNTKARDL